MNKLKFGIIGMGNRGKYIYSLIQNHQQSEVTAVCDNNPDKLLAYHIDGIGVFNNFIDVINNSNVDAVFITTPDNTHGEIMTSAINFGKHIICEKPLEISENEINRILKQAQTKPNVIALGYVLRYSQLFQMVKRVVESGIIGRVINVHAVDNISYGGHAFFHDWHRRRDNITSLLLQKASHSLDIINWLVNSRPSSVAAFGGLNVFGGVGALRVFGKEVDDNLCCSNCKIERQCEESLINCERVRNIKWRDNWPDSCVYNNEVDVDDNQVIIIKYENDAKASYTLNQFSPSYKREYILYGDKGRLQFDDVSNKAIVTFRNSSNKNIYEVSDLGGHGGGDVGLLEDFLDCCNTGKTPVASLEQSAVTSLVAIAAQKSIDEEQIVKITYKF